MNLMTACKCRLLRLGSSTAADLAAAETVGVSTEYCQAAAGEANWPRLSPSDLVSQGSFAVNEQKVQRPAAHTASRSALSSHWVVAIAITSWRSHWLHKLQ